MGKELVTQKLSVKKSLDPDCIGFGVQDHCYELMPPISESKLVKLEREFNLTLPDDYRSFITTIGNGGAGPSYGLYSIEGAITGDSSPPYGYPGRDRRKLVSEKFIRPDEMGEDEWSDEKGVLILCQHGCANDDFLVLNGKEKGTVWSYLEWVGHMLPELTFINGLPQDKRVEAEKRWVDQILLAPKEQVMTFSDWYMNWLEKPPHILPNAKKRETKRSGLSYGFN